MEEFPKPLTIRSTEKILNQMNNSIYKIDEKEEEFAIFCKIKLKEANIPVLISSFKVINEKYIQKYNNKIKVSINNEIKTIELGNIKYLNKEYDLSIVEIKDDEVNNLNYLELDDILYKKQSKFFYNKETIYIIHYSDKNEVLVSYGIIQNINKADLIMSCNINAYSNISPIFNLSNNKLIGLYKNRHDFYIKGIFFKFIIDEFINIFKNNKNMNNEIDILIKVNEKDINKNSYFLNKYENKNNKNFKNYLDDLKELNESNTELYINNEKYKYNKY